MKANELRIGNWVDDGKGFFYQFKREDFANTDLSKTIPIDLSPDILEKCGFENYLGSKFWTLNRWFTIEWDGTDFFYDLFGNKTVEIKYLHQLQNFYYALTGNELTYKP